MKYFLLNTCLVLVWLTICHLPNLFADATDSNLIRAAGQAGAQYRKELLQLKRAGKNPTPEEKRAIRTRLSQELRTAYREDARIFHDATKQRPPKGLKLTPITPEKSAITTGSVQKSANTALDEKKPNSTIAPIQPQRETPPREPTKRETPQQREKADRIETAKRTATERGTELNQKRSAAVPGAPHPTVNIEEGGAQDVKFNEH